MIEIYGLNTDALHAEVNYRRSQRAHAQSRRPLPRTNWFRRNTAGR